MKGMRWLLAGLLSALFVTAAEQPLSAEEASNPTPRPGIQVGDRFLGFVPKHEQVLLDRGVPLDVATAQPTSRAELWTRPPSLDKLPEAESSSPSEVQTANYEVSFDAASPCGCEGACNGTDCQQPRNNFPRIWGRAEYLYLWTNGVDVPSLATSSPTGTVQDDAGVLPNASTLFGNDTIHDGNSAGRFSLGMWLNPDMRSGVEFTFLLLGEDTASFRADQTDFDILGRPFFNVDSNEQDARLIAFDGLVEGSLDINSTSSFESYEILLRRAHSMAAGGRTDMLYGLRRAKLDDVLRISEQTTSLAEPTAGTQFDLFDQFATQNEFYGALIGFDYVGPAINNWSLGLLAKVAVGYTDSTIDTTGQTTITTDPGGINEAIITNAGGLLTQTSNVGSSDEQAFSTMSEVNFTLSRRWQSGLGLRLGYTFLLWHEVARAGEQIDVSLNPTQIAPGTLTGAARPSRFERLSNFWAQGISAGIEYRF